VDAGTKQDAPEGLPVGRVVFAPWFENEVLGDDNLFRRRDSQDVNVPPLGGVFPGTGDIDSDGNGVFDPPVVSDVETTVSAGVTMYIPFRMSNLQFEYEGNASFYRKSTVENADSHRGLLLLDLNSSTHHSFVLEGSHLLGITQRLRADDDPTDVELIEGVPLVRKNWAFEWAREVPQRPSWKTRLEWVDQRYEPDLGDSLWVDYTGWTGRAEYGQPIYRRGYLSATYSGRRQDQFKTRSLFPTDNLLRSESYDAIQVGFRGLIGRNQPVYAALGYGKLDYEKPAPALPLDSFRGLVGNVTWRLPVGSASQLSVSAGRQPTASLAFDTYYVNNIMRVRFDRPAFQASRYGAVTLFAKGRYGAPFTALLVDPTRTVLPCSETVLGDIIRRDTRKQIEGFWEWFIQPRMALRMTAGHYRRDTNCDNGIGSYVSNSVGMTFRVGWFD
jgi:hypothetical protein